MRLEVKRSAQRFQPFQCGLWEVMRTASVTIGELVDQSVSRGIGMETSINMGRIIWDGRFLNMTISTRLIDQRLPHQCGNDVIPLESVPDIRD
jgi:hypothetical protein